MEIKVLFFGATADIACTRSKTFQVSSGAKAGTLLADVTAQYPALQQQRLLISVNQKYARGDSPLSQGDEVAIFTTVSGG
jgi:molybdopterin converting factor small subunit